MLLLSDGIDGVTAIDLDNRIAGRRVIPGERAGDQPYRITVTGDHVVVGWGEIYAQPLSGAQSAKIDDATTYVPAAESGEVWTVAWEGERVGLGPAVVRRVNVNGTVTFSSSAWDTGIMFPLLHSSSAWSRYGDPEVDALLEKGRSSLDDSARLAAYTALHEYVKKEVPIIPLYQAAIIYGGAAQLEWQPTANESMFLNRMGWSD